MAVRGRAGVRVGVLNLSGQLQLTVARSPFPAADAELAELERRGADVLFVDFHAEVTSEKIAMGWHLDGKATLVVGTHTHVQTADERILPNGTAYLTDAGMTGPHDSIIGMERESAMTRFLTGMPSKFEPASGNPRLNGVIVEADERTGRAIAVTRISYSERDLLSLPSTGSSAGSGGVLQESSR